MSGGKSSSQRSRSAKPNSKASANKSGKRKTVTLKSVAEHLGLSTATVSLVLNRSPVADSIPRETHDRVFAAARELNYRPNYLARSLRRQRSFSVGVLVPEISEGYAADVMHGIEAHLLREGYFYLVASHRLKSDLLDEYVGLLEQRSVEGFITVAAPLEKPTGVPTVAVAGHLEIEGVTNVVLDHDHAIRLAIEHLVELGHQRIAFFKGHPNSPDTEVRWRSIEKGMAEHGLPIHPELWLQLSGEPTGEVYSPEEGYREGYAFGRKLLDQSRDFTALFAFNDISAIGATRALLDAGLHVPDDVSIVGFDDIQVASFHNPSLTTVRQPLFEMGELASRILLERIAGKHDYPPFVFAEASLVVRESTTPPGRRK